MTQQEVIGKVKSKKENSFKRGFLLVCSAVEKVWAIFEERIDSVDSNKMVGYRVSWKTAFVEEKIFVKPRWLSDRCFEFRMQDRQRHHIWSGKPTHPWGLCPAHWPSG